jgi:hypothetical protein
MKAQHCCERSHPLDGNGVLSFVIWCTYNKHGKKIFTERQFLASASPRAPISGFMGY